MGHHFLEVWGRTKSINDLDLFMVHHFLMLSAKELQLAKAIQSLAAWRWEGPGVWEDVNIEEVCNSPRLFETAEKLVETFGKEIPSSYLNKLSPKGVRFENQSTHRIIDILRDLENFTRRDA